MSKRVSPTSPGTLLAFALALVTTGCGSDGMLGVDGGNVRFVLSAGTTVTPVDGPSAVDATGTGEATLQGGDALHGDDGPHRLVQSANVTFTSILARNVEGVLVGVDMDLPVTVDVVTMEGGRKIQLPDGDLPSGTYDQVVVVMSQVQVVLHDGTAITIDPPGGGWTAIVPICPFDVDDTVTTTVALELDVWRAFAWRDSRFHFQPRFRCGGDQETSE